MGPEGKTGRTRARCAGPAGATVHRDGALRPESRSSWKAGREGELGGARLQVAQGRIGEGRERFVIVGLHPALERDAESEHAHLRPQARVPASHILFT